MRHAILLSLFFLRCQAINAQHLEQGYVVTLKGDTVQAEIKVPRDLFGTIRLEVLERKIKTADSSATEFKTLTQKDIRSYSFNYKGQNFFFELKNLSVNNLQFFRKLTSGKYAACYYYFTTGNKGEKDEFVIIEKSEKEQACLKNKMTKKRIRQNLKKLFFERPDVCTLIDQVSIKKRHLDKSLTTLVDSINAL